MSLLGVVAIACASFAQSDYDPDAKEVLDELSEKTKAYTSITAKFKSTLKNTNDGINVTEEGKVIVKGKKYVLEMGELVMMSDGKDAYSIDKDMNEAYTVCDNEDSDPIFKDPSQIFTLYEEGFKYSYGGLSGGTHTIKLYPEDAGDADYHTVELQISDSKMQITKIVISGKDGNTYTYEITSFEANKEYNDNTFKFDEDDYPGIDVYDDC